MRLRVNQSTMDSVLPPTTSSQEDSFAQWRAKAFLKLKDAIPKLKRSLPTTTTNNKKKKKPAALLHKWFESQRHESLASLMNSSSDTTSSSSGNEKVNNLKQLLSLPLDVNDLETCLSLGVAGALQETTSPETLDAQLSGNVNLDLVDLDADAEFLAQLLLGEDQPHSDRKTTRGQAEELLERLQQPPGATPASASSSVQSSASARSTGFVGATAQLTAVVLMIAQVLIGAQLLRRFRKRKSAKHANDQGSNSTLNPHASSESRRMSVSSRRLSITSQFTEHPGGGFSTAPPATITETAGMMTATTPTRTNGNASTGTVSLQRHLSQDLKDTDKARGESPRNNGSHDDDRTAETDSLSLSEGVPQKEDQNLCNESPASADSSILQTHQKEVDLLAQLSFLGNVAPSRSTLQPKPPPVSNVMQFQDKFALRMSKLRQDLFTVKEEQTTKLKDSTVHVKDQYQTTNVQYSDLTERLEKLTQSIQTRRANATAHSNNDDSSEASGTNAAFLRSATVKTNNRGTTTGPAASLPKPMPIQQASMLQQAHAQVQANDEEHAKLLTQVTSLQQDLKGQQERHSLILKQREGKMAELNTKIQFLTGEIERREAHAKRMKVETEQESKLQKHLEVLEKQLTASRQQQEKLQQELRASKQQATAKETECQQLLGKLRAVPQPQLKTDPSATQTAASAASEEAHHILIKELQEQLEQQDAMNKRTLEMTQLLEAKRADVIAKTLHLEETSKDIQERHAKLKVMEETAASYQQQKSQQSMASVTTGVGGSTEELEAQLKELQDQYVSQSLECEKLNEILMAKSKQLREKEAECLDLTARLEELTEQLEEKEEKIEQLEQDVQDKQDLAAQNEAITSELQVQQELQEKMNQTTLQMIKLLEDKEQANAELTNKLETLTTELNQSKSGLS